MLFASCVLDVGQGAGTTYFSLHPSGTLLASCGNDGQVEVFVRQDGGEWALGCTLADHVGAVRRCSWCPTQNIPVLATVGADRAIFVYNFQRTIGEEEHQAVLTPTRWNSITRGHEKDVLTDVAFVPEGQSRMTLLSTTSLDGRVRLYEVKPNAPLERIAVWCPDPLRSEEGAQVGGVSCLAWFPGRSERRMTLAVGCLSGKWTVAHCSTPVIFQDIKIDPVARCTAPVLAVCWAPPVGRRFSLLAVCSRKDILLIRFPVVSPSLLGDGTQRVEVCRVSVGGCSVSWSKSASRLLVASDDSTAGVRWVEMVDPADHQSWVVVGE